MASSWEKLEKLIKQGKKRYPPKLPSAAFSTATVACIIQRGEPCDQFDCLWARPVEAFRTQPWDKQHPSQDMQLLLHLLPVGENPEDGGGAEVFL
jgi:hypothetical protein